MSPNNQIFHQFFIEAKYDKDIFQILCKFMLQAHIYNEYKNPIPKKAFFLILITWNFHFPRTTLKDEFIYRR